MNSAHVILLIFTILHGGVVFSIPHDVLVYNTANNSGGASEISLEVPQNLELVRFANNLDNSTILQRNAQLLRLPQLTPKFVFEEYDRALGFLNMMDPEDYKKAVKESFKGDTKSLQKILKFAETLPEDRLTYMMYSELYELMVNNKYDRIEDYIAMWYMIKEKPRLDSKWSVLSQYLIRKVAERMLKDSPKLCVTKGYKNFTWIDHVIKKDDVKGVLFKKAIEQLYDMDKKYGEYCFGNLLFKWEEIMPETSDWVYKYVLTFDILRLRVRGLDKVQDMFLATYDNRENSLQNQYAYKLTVSMLELIYTDGLDEMSFDRLQRITAYHSYNIKRAATADKVCIRSEATWYYLCVDPMSDGVNWKAEVCGYGDTSTRGHWRITPVPDAGDGFYLTNVYTGLDFSVLMKNAETDSASSRNASRTVYTFYGGNAFVTLAERDTKKKLAIVDGKLKMLSAEDIKYYKWTVEGC